MKTKEAVCKRIILSIFFLLVLCRTAGAQDARKGILSAADAGTCTANSTACSFLTIPSGSGGVTFTITANASANTIQFEATGDTEPTGSHTWVALNVVPSNGTTAVTSTTSTGTWQANIAGFTQVRLRCSTFVGGTTTTYINLSTASARSGGGGSVTHTAGNLTAFHLMLGNGLADSTVDSACVTNGTGALSGCTSLSAGSGASAAGPTATGGFACVEGASTGWTPTAGQDYIRCDSTLHTPVQSSNGLAEQPFPAFTPAMTGMSGTGSGTGIQGLGTGINIVSPQSKQIDLQNNGSNGGATFRFLDDFGTGDQELRLWATAATGYDVLMASAISGNPVGLILATQGSTFISMRPNNLAETVRFPGSGGIQLGTGQDVGVSREGASILDVGNGTQGDVTGTLKAAAYLPASTTHALTMPVTIGSGTSIGSTILCAAADCPAGTYEIPTYIDITTPCGTTGTYVVNLIYTDDQGAKTIPVNINGTGAVPATGVLTTTSTANFGEDVQVIRVASGNINYSTTAAACGTAGPMVGKLYMTADRKM